MNIQYINGDLFEALNSDTNKFVPHVCNNIGKFGSGFAAGVCKHYPVVREQYLKFCEFTQLDDRLGQIQCVPVADNVTFVNMIGQKGVIGPNNFKPIKYAALIKCMETLGDFLIKLQKPLEILAPKFGSGLSGGNWAFIEELIDECWLSRTIPVTVYELV
jgi:hypothetical protein